MNLGDSVLPPLPSAFLRGEGEGLQEQRREYQRHDRHQLDQDVQGRSRRVFEGVTDRIAHDDGRVLVGALAAMIALLDPLFSIVPGPAGVGHHDGQQEARRNRSHEQSAQCLGA